MAGDLLTFLKREPAARKVFGKRELRIVEKQLKGVSLTQSEKNRLSRDVRKKFEFIRLAARYSDEFGLKKGAELQRRINDAMDAIRNDESYPEVRRVWLFGSAATNELSLASDIDLAVELDEKTNGDHMKFLSRVLGSLPDGIDLKTFNALPTKIRKEIHAKGRILYERED